MDDAVASLGMMKFIALFSQLQAPLAAGLLFVVTGCFNDCTLPQF